MMQGYDIVCLGSASWNDLWVNAQHVMHRLSSTNRILYIESTGLRLPSKSDLSKVKRRLARLAGGVKQINQNLWVIAPFSFPLYRLAVTRKFNNLALRSQASAMARRLGFERPILWLFLPTGSGLIGHLNERLLIYHCVDDYSANPNVDQQTIRSLERLVLHKADVVLTTSQVLFQEKKQQNANTYYMPNVADVELFQQAARGISPHPEMQQFKPPVIGYIGNISNYKFDIELVIKLARQHPEWAIVLVGPVGIGDPSTDIQELQSIKNIHLLGAKAYPALPAYLVGFDVAIIPFRSNASTRSSFPLKFHEYLAAGKKIVSINLPALEQYSELICLANSHQEFVQGVEKALEEEISPEVLSMREQVLRINSWEVRIQEISAVILKHLNQKGIVHRGNPLC